MYFSFLFQRVLWRKNLNKIIKKIDIKDYSLKEIATYFEKFNNSTITSYVRTAPHNNFKK